MAPSNSYYSFESNSSSYSFWNSPDYFKLYDDINIWNQTITILNHTTSSIPPLLASVSPSTATKYDQYDDSFSFDDDDDDGDDDVVIVPVSISKNNNVGGNSISNKNIIRNGKNNHKLEHIGRRSETGISNTAVGNSFRNLFNGNNIGGKGHNIRITSAATVENANLLDGSRGSSSSSSSSSSSNSNINQNLNHDNNNSGSSIATAAIDYTSGEFGEIDGSNGYSNTQTGGFHRFFNSKNATNDDLLFNSHSNNDDISDFDSSSILIGDGGDSSIGNSNSNNVISNSNSEIYQNYDTGGGGGGIGGGGVAGGSIGGIIDSGDSGGGNGIIGNRNLGSNGFNGLSNSNSNGNGASGSNFMLLFEDFGEYFYNYNNSNSIGSNNNDGIFIGSGNGGILSIGATSGTSINITDFDLQNNCSAVNTTCTVDNIIEAQYNYWALILILFPILTLFGNILVILAVVRERSLQSVTNYFIVSLALADLLVAVFVMPFGVYVLVSD